MSTPHPGQIDSDTLVIFVQLCTTGYISRQKCPFRSPLPHPFNVDYAEVLVLVRWSPSRPTMTGGGKTKNKLGVDKARGYCAE